MRINKASFSFNKIAYITSHNYIIRSSNSDLTTVAIDKRKFPSNVTHMKEDETIVTH